MKSSIFQISHSKIWRISALKVYLKGNQKVVHTTNIFSTQGKPSLTIQKNWSNCPISRDIQHQNFKGRNPSNCWAGNLKNHWLHKFSLTFRQIWTTVSSTIYSISTWKEIFQLYCFLINCVLLRREQIYIPYLLTVLLSIPIYKLYCVNPCAPS